jgi:hypothetical protein
MECRASGDRSGGGFRELHLPKLLRPTLRGLESDDADWIVVLAGKQVLNNRFELGPLVIGLAPRAPFPTNVVGYQVDRS